MSAATVGVVIATRNRATRLLATLDRLTALPERPPILVVDNASDDGTRARLADRFPEVHVLGLPANRGALARNYGVQALSARYIAFSDDDSWWAPGSLAAAAGLMEAHPRLGLLAARTLVGEARTPDPLNDVLADSPAPARDGLPGPPVLGFLGCAAVVRRSAFLSAGGYHPLLFFGAEETLLAYDLTAAGWHVCYAPQITAVHQPATGPRPSRGTLVRRNEVLTAWLRRPLPEALRQTWRLARDAPREGAARHALAQLLPRLPAAVRGRRPLPDDVEAHVRRLELSHAAR
ncbi:glycosyltransferase [Streptomyces sp. MP131-18]|uniref:glycosyltransferase family 2 protein n=1 Tax=Streptomyces sp. MP131-18 TaxID=1857892 RepID=UPI00097C91BD|nr:glycosyltransferase [Streptomyces sp. MP131-18]ONK10193.1 mycofactocin system glycosyltransferase [Streptomyces sp. MP131-18]